MHKQINKIALAKKFYLLADSMPKGKGYHTTVTGDGLQWYDTDFRQYAELLETYYGRNGVDLDVPKLYRMMERANIIWRKLK